MKDKKSVLLDDPDILASLDEDQEEADYSDILRDSREDDDEDDEQAFFNWALGL